MDPSTLYGRQRQLNRGDRQLRALEREQLRTVREITGTLESARKRLERRRDWLRELEEVLQEEERALKELQSEFAGLVEEAVYHVTQMRRRVEDGILAAERELQETEEQTAAVSEAPPEPAPEEAPDVKVYVHAINGDNHTQKTPETRALVQWYYPGQSQVYNDTKKLL